MSAENKAIVFGETNNYGIGIKFDKWGLNREVTLSDKDGKRLGEYRMEGELDYSNHGNGENQESTDGSLTTLTRADLDVISEEFSRVTGGEKIVFFPAFKTRKPGLPSVAISDTKIAFYTPSTWLGSSGDDKTRFIRDKGMVIALFPPKKERVGKGLILPPGVR